MIDDGERENLLVSLMYSLMDAAAICGQIPIEYLRTGEKINDGIQKIIHIVEAELEAGRSGDSDF